MKLGKYLNGLQVHQTRELRLKAPAAVSVSFKPNISRNNKVIDAGDVDPEYFLLSAAKEFDPTSLTIYENRVIHVALGTGVELRNVILKRQTEERLLEMGHYNKNQQMHVGLQQKVWPHVGGVLTGFQWRSGEVFDPNLPEMKGDVVRQWDEKLRENRIVFKQKIQEIVVKIFRLLDGYEYAKMNPHYDEGSALEM